MGGTPATTATEEYDGSSWTTVTSKNGPSTPSGGGGGIQTAAVVFGANTITESYDGTSWTNQAPMSTGRSYLAGCAATSASALGFGGYSGGVQSATEEYTGSTATATASTLTTS
jgi:hypothetical protein